jgi:hypothetical protein
VAKRTFEAPGSERKFSFFLKTQKIFHFEFSWCLHDHHFLGARGRGSGGSQAFVGVSRMADTQCMTVCTRLSSLSSLFPATPAIITVRRVIAGVPNGRPAPTAAVLKHDILVVYAFHSMPSAMKGGSTRLCRSEQRLHRGSPRA